MRGELIALDLETTGLDIGQDSIIEIAAVRVREGEILEEFSSLIDPGRTIPPLITQLTGITTDDVRGAPKVEQVIPRLISFAGNAPIIAHNISLDSAFLTREGALQNNLRLDTYELASALIPRSPRYTLGALAAQFDIDLTRAHRALDDTRATALLYWQLWQRMLSLPPALLEEIIAASRPFRWNARPVFEAALSELNALGARPTAAAAPRDAAAPVGAPAPAVMPSARTPAAIFAADGPLSVAISGYEPRSGQVQMAEAVERTLEDGGQLLIEAATGIGKSFAYLAPALQRAARGERVVISTSTHTLQEQLLQKDIPTLSAALGLPVNAALMKGRVQYLCPRRFAALRARGPATLEELQLLVKLLVWSHETGSGLKSDITLRGMEHQAWARLSAEEEGCTDDMCAAAGGQCAFYQARRAAEAAPLLVVNHALLTADALADHSILPHYDTLIIDESQHLEEAITYGASFSLDAPALRARLRELGADGRALLLDHLLRAVKAGAPDERYRRVEAFAQTVREGARGTSAHAGALFGALDALMQEIRQDIPTQRITEDIRKRGQFEQAAVAWHSLADFMSALSEAMATLGAGLRKLEAYPIPDRLDLARAAEASAAFFSETIRQLNAFFGPTRQGVIAWLSIGHEERGVVINTAPAHVGDLLRTTLWDRKRSLVLTGATLQVANAFDFVRDRLGLHGGEEIALPSPFDHKQAVLHYQPSDLPDPSDKVRYQAMVERAIVELAVALEGRLLVLFTSYAQLRLTSQNISARLALGNITVYDSLDASGRGAALEGFKLDERAVLMGTRSFWEGVDLPSDSLRGLIIVRLPFSVPTDPIFAARADQYNDSFSQYSVPEAVIKFRQGFGRLIRRVTDKGVFVTLDGRLTSKGYGRTFIDSLPECTTQKGPLEGLPAAARKWLE